MQQNEGNGIAANVPMFRVLPSIGQFCQSGVRATVQDRHYREAAGSEGVLKFFRLFPGWSNTATLSVRVKAPPKGLLPGAQNVAIAEAPTKNRAQERADGNVEIQQV